MKAALLPMLAAVLVPALVGQTPRSTTAAAPQPSGTGVITGAVVSTESDAKPVRLAYVVIIGAATGVLRVTSTDQAGRFSFANLPADRYVVGASKAPYLGAVAGARRPARPAGSTTPRRRPPRWRRATRRRAQMWRPKERS